MNCIYLRQTLPQVFADRTSIHSDVWHKEVEFRKGNNYLIEAASGTGKSSLCNYIYGYRKDYQGIICFDDTNVSSLTTNHWVDLRCRSISLLFQDLRLFSELTAFDNVLLKNNLTHHKQEKEIAAMLKQLGLADYLRTPVSKLSFGQQQRVAFIRALCQPFDFIFLDEPISHLDEDNGRLMADMLMAEAALQGAGVVVTSIGKHLNLTYDTILKL